VLKLYGSNFTEERKVGRIYVNMTESIDRRQFLSGFMSSVFFPYVIPSSVLGKTNIAPSDRITMGYIGVGGRGKQVMRSLMGQRGCQILAVCDVDTNRLSEARNIVNDQYGNSDCTAYRNYRRLLGRTDIDAVLIASPDQWHV